MAAMSAGDTVGRGTKAQLEDIERAIRGRIAAAALPDEVRLPARLPHHALARWIRRVERSVPVEIFTTNYDTLLERALEDQRIPFYDGFSGGRKPFFLGATPVQDYEPGRGWTRLWKIHGSVTWAWHDVPDAAARIVRGPEQPGGELILPSFHKYDESRRQPYASMLDRLARVLTTREDTLLVTTGFSFGDEHLNAVIFDALETRARLSVVALQHHDPADDPRPRETRAKPSQPLRLWAAAGIVGGETASWRLTEAVDKRAADLLDIPFDSDAKPGADDVADTGRFRLEDFAWFARFLDTLARPDAGRRGARADLHRIRRVRPGRHRAGEAPQDAEHPRHGCGRLLPRRPDRGVPPDPAWLHAALRRLHPGRSRRRSIGESGACHRGARAR